MSLSTKELEPIAERINAHLVRFEADPVINAPRTRGGMTTTPYFSAQAVTYRKRVHVRYVSYQGDSALTDTDAVRYLQWLDAGNVGRHFEALRG